MTTKTRELMLKTYTLTDIRAVRPCYDPSRYLPVGWTGTLRQIAEVDACPYFDRLFVITALLQYTVPTLDIGRTYAQDLEAFINYYDMLHIGQVIIRLEKENK